METTFQHFLSTRMNCVRSLIKAPFHNLPFRFHTCFHSRSRNSALVTVLMNRSEFPRTTIDIEINDYEKNRNRFNTDFTLNWNYVQRNSMDLRVLGSSYRTDSIRLLFCFVFHHEMFFFSHQLNFSWVWLTNSI